MEIEETKPRNRFRWKRRLIQLVAIGGILMLALSWTAKRPENLGIVMGKLTPCPETPNCVSTTSKNPNQKMDPIPFQGSPAEAMQRLVSVVEAMPRSKVISQRENYLYVEFTSLIFRYVDDVEFLIDSQNNRIDFRSASRVGHSDLGANRKRMSTISERFTP